MRTIWILAAVAATFLLVSQAAADTVYLKDGRSFWGRQAYEEGDWVILVRPDGDMRFRKDEVSRIQPVQTTLPRFYVPPSSTPASAAGPAAPGVPARGAALATPAAGTPPAPPQVSGLPAGSPPAGPSGPPAVAAPPPPPPPPGGGTPSK